MLQIIHNGAVSRIDRSSQKFLSEIDCAAGFCYTSLTSNHESFPVNYSLILHTTKVFHLEWFAMHGIS